MKKLHEQQGLRDVKWKPLVKDYSLFLAFPLILILAFVLLSDCRTHFILNVKNPAWYTLITNSFTHKDWSHLMGNVKGYLLGIFILLPLAYQTDLQKELKKVVLALIFIAPVISASANIIAGMKGNWFATSQGASDIVAAIIGLIPSFLFILIKQKWGHIYEYALYSVGFLGLVMVRDRPVAFIIYAVLVQGIFIGYFLITEPKMKRLLKQVTSGLFILFVVCLLPGLIYMFFPEVNLGTGTPPTNIFSHLMGLFTGMFMGGLVIWHTQLRRKSTIQAEESST